MDERARELGAFIDARSCSLLRYAYLLTGDHGLAQDLLQNSLIKVYLSWDRIRDRAALEAYTRTVMTRTQLSWWRRPARREVLGVEPTERAVRDLHHVHERNVHERDQVDERDELWALLATLGPRQRAVLVLRFYEDLSEAEIARVLGCTTGTVKSQLSRGLARLRERMPAEPQTRNTLMEEPL
ncbi:MAG: SigE family RNA polymerase sigma factor [Dermatophilaceae bacterium]